MEPDAIDRLVRQVQRGDQAAFAELFRACYREVRIFVSAHAPSVDVVDEVIQAAFVTCYEQIRRYELRGTFLMWLKGIARNTLLKELRDRARHARLSGDTLDEALAGRALAAAEAASAPDSRMAPLRSCLDRLPSQQRELVHRRYAEGVPLDRIAQQLGRSENWVAVNLFRIRKALKECVERAGGRT